VKIEDRVETQERFEKLTDEQRDDYFTALVMGKDVTEDIKTSRGDFRVKYPTAADLLAIGRVAAFRRNYKPVEAFDASTEILINTTATLDVIVLSGPKWFEDAKSRNKNFTFLEVPSREFIAELYGKAYSFREKVEQSFNPAEEPDDRSIPAKKGDDAAVDGGAFGNLSSEQVDTESE
jgi:hypothetical protein